MGAKLQALFALQDIESQIVDIRRQLARKQRQVKAQQRKLDAKREEIEQRKADIQHTQAEFDRLDVDIKARSANIDKMREHLNSVRTNKEYATLLAQMNNEKADVTRLETRAMEVMQAVEAKKAELAEIQAAESGEIERLEELQAELEQARASFGGRLAQLEKQRELAAEQIDAETLKLFDRLSEHYEGEVLAEVERPNPRRDEFICGGCHMALRMEVANTLRSRDEIVTCKSCGRILFIDRNT